MSKKIRTEAVDYLFKAILSLENKEECYTFFEDICTINELLSLSQRFEVAKMLREQKTYLEIAEQTGASTATISRVNRSLNYGNDGYDMVFERIDQEEERKTIEFQKLSEYRKINNRKPAWANVRFPVFLCKIKKYQKNEPERKWRRI